MFRDCLCSLGFLCDCRYTVTSRSVITDLGSLPSSSAGLWLQSSLSHTHTRVHARTHSKDLLCLCPSLLKFYQLSLPPTHFAAAAGKAASLVVGVLKCLHSVCVCVRLHVFLARASVHDCVCVCVWNGRGSRKRHLLICGGCFAPAAQLHTWKAASLSNWQWATSGGFSWPCHYLAFGSSSWWHRMSTYEHLL